MAVANPLSTRRRARCWTRRSAPLALAGLALGLVAQSGLASSTTAPGNAASPADGRGVRVAPPAGTTWIEGVITDQAGTPQDNVNVEAWASDAPGSKPTASALSYGGAPDGTGSGHGFFLLEVPSDQAVRIDFSAVGGHEDGDPFRMKLYGQGRPIVVRPAARSAGRVRDLGTIVLARQGRVVSRTKASLVRAGVPVRKRAALKVTVTSPFVSNVTGFVVIRVAGRRVVDRLVTRDHGKSTLRLPRLSRSKAYPVHVAYLGSGTIKRSSAKTITLHVHRK